MSRTKSRGFCGCFQKRDSALGRFRLFSNFERNTALPHQAEIGFSLSEHAESLLDLAFLGILTPLLL
jgi:hypothetical protein